jgi:predicted MFS family arabinose efflux permease
LSPLSQRRAITIFVAFAVAYFLSTLLRAITATLAPTLAQEFALNASDLGLLAGGYFFGFALTQLPLGTWLDRFGPKRVVLGFLSVAVLGNVAFAVAESFSGLLAARVLCGVGVSACLMAPLTAYRRWFSPASMMRSNSWMLMVGSMGMVASTLPVQWLLPVTGWRAIFAVLALLVALAMVIIAWQVPAWEKSTDPQMQLATTGYREVVRHPYFRRLVPLGFFNYGGMVAMQTLWAAPWMIKVAGYSPEQAASGLFWINVCMLLSFLAWGSANPWLARKGVATERLIAMGVPISLLLIAIIVIAGDAISAWSAGLWILYCVSSTVGSQAQPAVGMAFPPALAGRALSAYNLVIFSGVFAVQWGIGLLVDGTRALGLSEVMAFQAAMAVYGVCCIGAYLYFLSAKKS